ncbi:hypothetical protein XELAEV_18043376mg [Xenopus laevis]|uniref:Uncharacterized protein n=1 Tax=Xenopus laevis TaxID=8355 RepID=A0A974BX96_XENLA|nr:hypothetical protein XELAEV_18043376mg [Xenopus laevis]
MLTSTHRCRHPNTLSLTHKQNKEHTHAPMQAHTSPTHSYLWNIKSPWSLELFALTGSVFQPPAERDCQ